MLSVEHDVTARKRVRFNKPFDNIELYLGPVSDVIPSLDRDHKHILWLDYDYVFDNSIVADVRSAASELSPGSILIVTVDVEPPDKDGDPKSWFKYFEEEAGQYFPVGWGVGDFRRERLPADNVALLSNVIKDGVSARREVNFLPIFNFLYRDGHLMVTVGGIVATESEKHALDGCDFSRAPYVRKSLENEPYYIRVPVLTRKERLYMDAAMPAGPGWRPRDFALGEEDVVAYGEIYRFFPTYAELLLG